VLAVAAFAFAGLAHRAGDRVPAAQAVLLHLAQGDVDVIGAGQVAAGAHESVVVQHIEDSRHRQQDVVLGDDDLFLDLRTRAALAVPGAVPATTTTPGAFLIVAVAAAGAAGVVLLIVVRAAPFGQLDIVQRGVATPGLASAASCRGLALLRLATTVPASTMTAVAAGSTTAIAAAVLGLLLRLGAALTAGAVTTGGSCRMGSLGTGLLSGLACGQVGQVQLWLRAGRFPGALAPRPAGLLALRRALVTLPAALRAPRAGAGGLLTRGALLAGPALLALLLSGLVLLPALLARLALPAGLLGRGAGGCL